MDEHPYWVGVYHCLKFMDGILVYRQLTGGLVSSMGHFLSHAGNDFFVGYPDFKALIPDHPGGKFSKAGYHP